MKRAYIYIYIYIYICIYIANVLFAWLWIINTRDWKNRTLFFLWFFSLSAGGTAGRENMEYVNSVMKASQATKRYWSVDNHYSLDCLSFLLGYVVINYKLLWCFKRKKKKTFSAALSNMHAVFSITFYKN
jgi:hypothetical protein